LPFGCGRATKWIANIGRGDSTLTALMPFRQGHLPSVRAFIDRLTYEADVDRRNCWIEQQIVAPLPRH